MFILFLHDSQDPLIRFSSSCWFQTLLTLAAVFRLGLLRRVVPLFRDLGMHAFREFMSEQ